MSLSWSGQDRALGAWRLDRTDTGFLLRAAGEHVTVPAAEAPTTISVTRWPRPRITFTGAGQGELTLTGLTRRAARRLDMALQVAAAMAPVDEFSNRINAVVDEHWARSLWLPHDTAARVLDGRPEVPRLRGRRLDAKSRQLGRYLTSSDRTALDLLARDIPAWLREVNERIVARELEQRADFFAQVEKSPLTEEQARAVLTYDNRVRVVAAAGSGKTSVMVARAAYALERGLAAPERILLLAFNAAAAEELSERVRTRLAARGLPADGVQVRTFHSFGRAVMGRATGHKPSIARWVEQGREVEKITEIVDRLRDESPEFRYRWDVFRLLHGRGADGDEPDSYDPAAGLTGYRTFQGETVRSVGERLIADWLYLNGVKYEYERPYAHVVSDAEHAQYRPDFFYPDVDVWHEHWAVGPDGETPEEFAGYAESMAWRKQTHAQFGTRLVETTWHEIVAGDGLTKLEHDLRDAGLTLDWNPERPIAGGAPVEHERLAGLVRTFLSHVKSSALTPDDVLRRAGTLTGRSRLFLDIFWPIYEGWQAALAAEGAIDFDDMLLGAAHHIEADPALAPFDLVLVDEFQDTSRARARMLQAMLRREGTHLLTVGDDWQAINRFAGADLSIMTQFEEWFGPAQTLHLTTTFRCTQTIADVASEFVVKNPAQLRKVVRSASGPGGAPVTIIRVPSRERLPAAIASRLRALEREAPGVSVDVLGRYRIDRQFLPNQRFTRIDANFRTVHGSKGLEADHVILPNMTAGSYGFPSRISDDPVLRFAMADDDGFPFSEERRLFYVALTRARRGVTLFTVAGQESPFVVELIGMPGVVVADDGGPGEPVQACPACGKGTLVRRSGRYGAFLGCSRFPACRGKATVAPRD